MNRDLGDLDLEVRLVRALAVGGAILDALATVAPTLPDEQLITHLPLIDGLGKLLGLHAQDASRVLNLDEESRTELRDFAVSCSEKGELLAGTVVAQRRTLQRGTPRKPELRLVPRGDE